MDWENIAAGLDLLLNVGTLAYLVTGLVAGFVVGALPGFSGTSAAVVVLPFSIGLPTETALILIVGIYAGASFAGSIPAILINVPGTASAAATALDGYPMARQGRAQLAIGLARMSSTLGGILGALTILVVIQPLSDIALRMGAREVFFITVLGLLIIAYMMGKDPFKGLVSALLGALVAAMSASPRTGEARFTMGYLGLYESVPILPMIIGLFGISQMILLSRKSSILAADALGELDAKTGWRSELREVVAGIRMTFAHPIIIIRAAAIGVGVGAIPGLGTTVGNFLSYGVTKRRSKDPEAFGKGEPRGVIAAESCDNAVAGGTLIPTMTLGIPGSGVAAVMLAALFLHGITPGPRVMVTHTAEVYAVFLGLLVSSILILPLGTLLASPLVRIVRTPPAILVSCVLMLCVIGTVALRNSIFDAALAIAFGFLGVAMRIRGYPVIPFVIAMILGPIAESNFFRALDLGSNDPLYFIQSPAGAVLFAVIIGVLVLQVWSAFRRSRRRNREPVEEVPTHT